MKYCDSEEQGFPECELGKIEALRKGFLFVATDSDNKVFCETLADTLPLFEDQTARYQRELAKFYTTEEST